MQIYSRDNESIIGNTFINNQDASSVDTELEVSINNAHHLTNLAKAVQEKEQRKQCIMMCGGSTEKKGREKETRLMKCVIRRKSG